MEYEYKMIQTPNTLGMMQRELKGISESEVLARYMENVVNQNAKEGWEFYRTDQMSLAVRPGCLPSLMGAKETFTNYNVVTFRRTK